MSFGDPTEIKDVPCSRCGSFVSEDELYDLDWDWGVCSECYDDDSEEEE